MLTIISTSRKEKEKNSVSAARSIQKTFALDGFTFGGVRDVRCLTAKECCLSAVFLVCSAHVSLMFSKKRFANISS